MSVSIVKALVPIPHEPRWYRLHFSSHACRQHLANLFGKVSQFLWLLLTSSVRFPRFLVVHRQRNNQNKSGGYFQALSDHKRDDFERQRQVASVLDESAHWRKVNGAVHRTVELQRDRYPLRTNAEQNLIYTHILHRAFREGLRSISKKEPSTLRT